MIETFATQARTEAMLFYNQIYLKWLNWLYSEEYYFYEGPLLLTWFDWN